MKTRSRMFVLFSVELSDDGLDTPYAGGRGFLLLDLESLQFGCVGDVGSSADLAGHIADGVDRLSQITIPLLKEYA